MAYAYRYHANSGPTRVNRTSWGPASAHAQIDVPNKIYERRLSGNFDRIINSFDRTNAFECVRSAFEQACSKNNKEAAPQKGEKAQHGAKIQNGADQNGVKIQNGADGVDGAAADAKTTLVSRPDGAFEKQIEENEKRDRFVGYSDVIVNGRGSSYERADVGLATRQTPCTDEDVTAYYQDRIYMSQARQLFPLQEDLADWINKTIGITYLTGDNFLDVLDNGVELCQLATVIRDKAKEASEKGLYSGVVPNVRGRCWQRAARRSFFSRDNMENFITFCRQLGVHENLLFESDDLVLQAQPRNVILCLLEVGRIASRLGVEPPGLVQLEREIALEEEQALDSKKDGMAAELAWQFQQDKCEDIISSDVKPEPPSSPIENEVSLPAALFAAESEGTPSIHTDDTWSRGTPEELDSAVVKPLSELDKRVQIVTRLMQRNCNCSEGRCSKLLKVKKVGEGRYNIAGRNVFIRLLKGRHMMVRVGGGWDTLEHFLTRHDPCQVRVISPQSSASIQKVTTVNLVRQSPAVSTQSISSVCTNNTDRSSDRLSIANGDISPAEITNVTSNSDKDINESNAVKRLSFENKSQTESNSDDNCLETASSDGKISSNSSKHSAEESCSETSSISGSVPPSIAKQMKTIKSFLASGKTVTNQVRPRSSTNTSKSSSGRTTPLSNGKVSPSNSKLNGKASSVAGGAGVNRKMSPSALKLDLTPNSASINSRVVNNRMESPVETSSRLLSASKPSTPSRTLRTPLNDGRKSFPCTVGSGGDVVMRRRSVNIPLSSSNPKVLKSPPVLSKSTKSPLSSRPFVPSRSNSLRSPVSVSKPLVSPSSIEKTVRMAVPTQDSQNKPFLHIRAKYRSPPPRDVPPR